jgi:hypothetical protein
LDSLLHGKLTGGTTGIALPAIPTGQLKLFFDDKALRSFGSWGPLADDIQSS